ncbi:sarcosine oxidase family domain-containing protein (plasmid) [Rhizobium etli]|uniref:Sarcosine oxidase family domain-containing protein n=1 Tax=Rhizobium etli TaxID=29449 RepID=A0AAN1EMY8_RHIET|nr:sarcosine oxidase family domain-containing protein [Rhizobium etli]
MIYDDGTTSRLSDDHFFMATTTAYAAGVMNHLEFCSQTLWPDLDVRLASATDQWAQMAIAGPKARLILQSIVDEDISNEAFPFLRGDRSLTVRRPAPRSGSTACLIGHISRISNDTFEIYRSTRFHRKPLGRPGTDGRRVCNASYWETRMTTVINGN